MRVEKEWGLCFVGFGNVGQGLARLLVKKEQELASRWGFSCRTLAVVGKTKGALVRPEGIGLADLLLRVGRGEPLGSDSVSPVEAALLPGVDMVIDVTPTNLKDGEPGLSLTRAALEAGRHVVTSDKGPVSLAFPELKKLAEARGCSYRFEGSVMSGTPSLNLALESLAGCDVLEAKGIVNGTTNYILTRMEDGLEYGEALREAMDRGYAEADPSGDVDGWDAAVKAQILAGVVLGSPLSLASVDRRGIAGITKKDVEDALARGYRIKLVAKASRAGGTVRASVAPEEVPLSHPLAGVSGATNALTFTTDTLGDVTIIGPGAGREETGQALLSDMLAIAAGMRNTKRNLIKQSVFH